MGGGHWGDPGELYPPLRREVRDEGGALHGVTRVSYTHPSGGKCVTRVGHWGDPGELYSPLRRGVRDEGGTLG